VLQVTTRRSRRRLGKCELEQARADRDGEVSAVRKTTERSMPGILMFSRRHIDLQRVAGALCPGAPATAPRCPEYRTAALPRTAG
jgi:hypothetical protein